MTIETNDAKNKNRELNDRAKQSTIVHETVPGEDPIRKNGTITQKDKAAVSTSDEDAN